MARALHHSSVRSVRFAVLLSASCAAASSASSPAPKIAPREVAAASVAPEVTPVAKAKTELPRGGRSIFPEHRLVGFCGTPGAPALGELQGNLAAKSKALLGYADKYAGGERKVLPVYELIAVVVQAGAGADGKYRRRVEDSTVDTYLRLAREAKGLFLLNIQPGQSDFLTEVKHFEKYLRAPDVGIALDPEWAMRTGQRPGKVYGQTTGAEINAVAEYLSKVIAEDDLPEKALVFHQVNRYVVKEEATVKPYPGVVVIDSVDGLGPKHAKIETYDNLMVVMPKGIHAGFKLFFDEDHRNGGQLMTPAEVLALKPPPDYVMYE
ncbi:MAG: hypothetical protein QOI41_350 [Myxococcales bacterium]|nr:hypothetical protein [Myxococcales bacterium]